MYPPLALGLPGVTSNPLGETSNEEIVTRGHCRDSASLFYDLYSSYELALYPFRTFPSLKGDLRIIEIRIGLFSSLLRLFAVLCNFMATPCRVLKRPSGFVFYLDIHPPRGGVCLKKW